MQNLQLVEAEFSVSVYKSFLQKSAKKCVFSNKMIYYKLR